MVPFVAPPTVALRQFQLPLLLDGPGGHELLRVEVPLGSGENVANFLHDESGFASFLFVMNATETGEKSLLISFEIH